MRRPKGLSREFWWHQPRGARKRVFHLARRPILIDMAHGSDHTVVTFFAPNPFLQDAPYDPTKYKIGEKWL